jgi:ABC-type molybdate transport system ATPase subunit
MPSSSGGRKQRLCTADALAPHPGVLPLEEPAANMDVSVQAHIIELLARLRRVISPPRPVCCGQWVCRAGLPPVTRCRLTSS